MQGAVVDVCTRDRPYADAYCSFSVEKKKKNDCMHCAGLCVCAVSACVCVWVGGGLLGHLVPDYLPSQKLD